MEDERIRLVMRSAVIRPNGPRSARRDGRGRPAATAGGTGGRSAGRGRARLPTMRPVAAGPHLCRIPTDIDITELTKSDMNGWDRTTATTQPTGTPRAGTGVAGYAGQPGLSYSTGISAESADARGLCLHTLGIPSAGWIPGL
jgi:hypothetical protein